MAERNRLTVQIANKEYTLVSEEPREYMLEVSDYVDRQMKKIKGLNACMSTNMVAVLTSINTADELFKLKRELKKTQEKLSDCIKKSEELSAKLERLRGRNITTQNGKNE